MNHEILKMIALTLFSKKSRKALIEEKTYQNLYNILRSSYTIFTPKQLYVSPQNRIAALMVISS